MALTLPAPVAAVQLEYALLLLLPVAVALAVIAPPRIRRRRRARLFTAPFPDSYRRILERNLPLFRRMPPTLRDELCGHISVFLREKRFRGCGGLEMTDEIRVTIAGNACLLLLNGGARYFPGFTSILVYPGSYLVDDVEYDGEVEIRGRDARSGESWHRGPVILSWDDVVQSFSEDADGQNVVLHEFAHKLDEENPGVEGLPVLSSASHYREWADVLTRTYENLERTLARFEDPAFDDYALTSPAEFFAVATESFFEKPAAMRQQFPELYAQFSRYYAVDPATWAA